MERDAMDYRAHFGVVNEVLTGPGLLLAAYDSAGRANAMAIGWGTVGSVWSMPMWTVLVRPSRYTCECIEHSRCFTVNVPTRAMEDACLFCGTKSGRDVDKLAVTGLAVEKASHVEAPVLVDCPIVYECQVVHSNDLVPDNLTDDILRGCYPAGDFHRVYFGKIIAARAAENAAQLLI